MLSIFKLVKFLKIPIILILIFNNLIFNENKASQNNFKTNTLNEKVNSSYNEDIDYILDSGDILEIIFSGLENYSANYPIRSDGTIIIPEFDRLVVKGLTIRELEKKLNIIYKEFIIDPNIKVFISSHRPVSIYLSGEIKRPGLYTLKNEISASESSINNFSSNIEINKFSENSTNSLSTTKTPKVFDALILGRGITKFANLSDIRIIRDNPINKGGGKIITNVDILSMLNNGDQSQNIDLRDGDSIHVTKSNKIIREQLVQINKTNLTPDSIIIYVNGNVDIPGRVVLPQGTTLYEAIASAGGKKSYTGNIEFIRFDELGNSEKTIFKYRPSTETNKEYNPQLTDGDIIIVRKNILGKTTEFMRDLATPIFTGIGLYEIFD